MNLLFLGRGAAFNPKEGNTSAYFLENNQLFLIDCGESIFERIINKKILNNIETINVIITHTHSDHVGSLGSLISYSYYKLHKPINIIVPNNYKFKKNLKNLLNIFGCGKNKFTFIDEKNYDNKYKSFEKVRFIKTVHSKNLICYSIIFYTNKGIIFYSGDTNDLNNIIKLISSNNKIDKIYIDTTTENYSGNVHLYIGDLQKVIPKQLIEKIYCMHLNDTNNIEMIKEFGFNAVEIK